MSRQDQCTDGAFGKHVEEGSEERAEVETSTDGCVDP